MKKLIVGLAVVAWSTAFAAELTNSSQENNIDKAPGVIPGKPTAESVAPKYSVQVPCTLNDDGKVVCVNVDWAPVIGGAHYVLVPAKKEQPAPAPVVVEKEKIVIKEVPVKPKKE